MLEINPKPIEEVRCPKCGYTWYTKSRRLYIVCPNCHYTFRKERGLLSLLSEK
ncbi:MAG: hypothetical protein QXY26_10595 [Ignisphaera sp.]